MFYPIINWNKCKYSKKEYLEGVIDQPMSELLTENGWDDSDILYYIPIDGRYPRIIKKPENTKVVFVGGEIYGLLDSSGVLHVPKHIKVLKDLPFVNS